MATTSDLKNHTELLDKSLPPKFWDLYLEEGTWKAMLWMYQELGGSIERVRLHLTPLREEADKRGIDIVKFLQEYENALGTNYGAGELSVGSSGEDNQPEAEDEPAPARDADGQTGDGEQETEGSEGV